MTTDSTTPIGAAGTPTQSGTRRPRSRRSRSAPLAKISRTIAGIAAASLLATGLSATPALAAPGNLDAGFSGGVVMTDFAPTKVDQGLAMALQKDGKIVVVGTTDSNTTALPPQPSDPHPPVNLDFAIARYNTNGTLDTSFGNGGKVVTAFSSDASPQSDSALAVAMQKDGKIVVGGSTFTDANNATFGLARYLSDGSLDPNFGTNGKVQTDFTPGVDGINGLAIQSDGKIVAAGVASCLVDPGTLCQQADVALARYNSDGSLDGSFGGNGKVRTEVPQGQQANAVALESDGGIVIAGIGISDGVDFLVSRYTPSGSLDSSFGTGGRVLTGVTQGQIDFANDVAIQADGRIVAGGATNKGVSGTTKLDDEFALVRYNPDGSLDSGFGNGGKVVTDVGPKSDGINALGLLSDGRIVAAGKSLSDQAPNPSRFAVARYMPDGDLDTSFAGDGTVTTAVDADNNEASGVAIQSDGKIVAGGYAGIAGTREDQKFAVVRYEGDGSPLIPPGGETPAASGGYWLTASDGGIFAFGNAKFQGSTGNIKLAQPIVGMAPTRSGSGYWLVASDGGIFAFGDAPFHGSTGNIKLSKPIVGMAATPSGRGYWLVASDGGIFAFGDASFKGSTGNIKLAQPIVAMASTASGQGYWLVASDGGIFAFGDARFQGSTGNLKLAKPIVGMAPTRSGSGYWLVASDGGIFAFGDAGFHGSTGNIKLAQPIVGMTATKSGRGYYMVASDGGIFAFGDASFHGSTGNIKLAKPIIGMAAL